MNQIKSANFNKYLEPAVTKEVALRDANDFVESCAILNKDSVLASHQVCIDEWLFAFAKTLCCNKEVFDKFIKDYSSRKEKSGSFREVMRTNPSEAPNI